MRCAGGVGGWGLTARFSLLRVSARRFALYRLLHAEGAELGAPAVETGMSRDIGADEMPPLLTASDWLQGQREFAQRAF
ncbi:MAG: hypothetical protein QXT13_02070 [Pyrobaculum sp.]